MKFAKAIFFIGFALVGLVSFRPSQPIAPARTSAKADTVKIDRATGLVDDSNLMMVKSQCTACHSSKLILQHRFSRAGWLERIRWMQKYHKLWDLGESEKVVLDYLEKNYGPQTGEAKAAFRRAPLRKVEWYKLN